MSTSQKKNRRTFVISVLPKQTRNHMNKRSKNKAFEAVFGIDSMVETFDRPAALYVLDHILPSEPESESRKKSQKMIKKLLKQSKGQSFITVHYEKGTNAHDKGRWYAKTPASMQHMPKRIRHTICQGLWVDLDFVNSHPTILLQLCQKLRMDCRYLEEYVRGRDEILIKMVQAGVNNRDEAKMCILKALNGGVDKINTPWWLDMLNEFKELASAIATHRDYKEFLEHCQKAGTTNLNAKVMSAVLCDLENVCLEQLYCFLQERECVPDGQCSLIFDGLMVPDTEHIRSLLSTNSFLKEASLHIEKTTGFYVDIKVKEFDQGYSLPNDYAGKITDITVIERGDDSMAADLFLEQHPAHLIRCRGRLFWCEKGIYYEDKQAVKNAIMSHMKELKIFVNSSNGLVTYSNNTKHIEDCTRLILSDTSIEQDDFIDRLWSSSLRYLAFEDGIYSFEDKTLHTYPVQGVLFTHKINRLLPQNIDKAVKDKLMEKLLGPSSQTKSKGSTFSTAWLEPWQERYTTRSGMFVWERETVERGLFVSSLLWHFKILSKPSTVKICCIQEWAMEIMLKGKAG